MVYRKLKTLTFSPMERRTHGMRLHTLGGIACPQGVGALSYYVRCMNVRTYVRIDCLRSTLPLTHQATDVHLYWCQRSYGLRIRYAYADVISTASQCCDWLRQEKKIAETSSRQYVSEFGTHYFSADSMWNKS